MTVDIQEYRESGVSFRYPATWQLEREENETGWTVSVQSPATPFFLVTFDEDQPSTDDMLQAALTALRSYYPELEAAEQVDTLAGQPAVGHDIQFMSFDLTNTCWVRSFYTATGTMLVLWQSNDLDLEEYEPVLRAICASLQVEDEY